MEDYHQNICTKFGFKELSVYQKDALQYIYVHNTDMFICLPTGGGKSAIFQSIPLFKNTKIIVFEPLISIMKEHVDSLLEKGFSATYIGKDESEEKDIMSGKFTFIYAGPEILGEDKWRDMLRSPTYGSTTGYFVVDEAHTVIQWGSSSEKKTKNAFRQWFGKIKEARSLCTDAVVLAFTATASNSQRKEIKESLAMKSNCKDIIHSPDRPNIQLNKVKVHSTQSLEVTFKWLILLLEQKGRHLPRHIIFCTNRTAIADIYKVFCDYFIDQERLFNMFHFSNTEKTKEKIRKAMENPSGSLRILIASQSAGMGVNLGGVNNVIHYGPPKDIDTLVQQIGRAGRSGEQSQQVLLYHGRQLSGIDNDIKLYIRNEEVCRRELLLKFYNHTPSSSLIPHWCCDICREKCECSPCDGGIPVKIDDEEDVLIKIRTVSLNVKLEFRKQIKLMFNAFDIEFASVLDASLLFALSDSNTKLIIKYIDYIDSVDFLLDMCNVWDEELAERLFDMIVNIEEE